MVVIVQEKKVSSTFTEMAFALHVHSAEEETNPQSHDAVQSSVNTVSSVFITGPPLLEQSVPKGVD